MWSAAIACLGGLLRLVASLLGRSGRPSRSRLLKDLERAENEAARKWTTVADYLGGGGSFGDSVYYELRQEFLEASSRAARIRTRLQAGREAGPE